MSNIKMAMWDSTSLYAKRVNTKTFVNDYNKYYTHIYLYIIFICVPAGNNSIKC